MAYCNQCGNQLAEGIKFCPKCGTAVPSPSAPAPAEPQPTAPTEPTVEPAVTDVPTAAPTSSLPTNSQMFAQFEKSFTEAVNNAADTTAEFDPKDIEANKIMALFSYLGILVIIPLFAARGSKFARYHVNQGLLLCIVAVVYTVAVNIITGVIGVISWRLASLCSLLNIVSLAFFAMAVVGILNSLNGKAKELPFIGKYRLLK